MDETINKYRIFPRLILFASGAFCWSVSQWFTELLNPTAEQSAYATGVVLACIGIVKYYIEERK